MRKTRSPIIDAVRDTAKGLGNAGRPDQVTLRELDPLWLPTVGPLQPAEIRRIRESAHVSQAVFARLLNTSLSTVQKWEIGQKRPAGTALKLLHLVQKRGLEVVA
ncbi:helix-turn-helix domain-containing protein [Noviherbaspirillum suwonense]|uniref:Transcriptional regulator n=1 Tax=Noviherbaspirillum suwonense TaxID=1224511 RepID=A0ABY1QVG4_9BURK|nr:DNA-binding transcriptional regulator [Noviherbaspirillum suwonense]SMP80311.1 putative transcriptional regulator [Noviherbaspirillum suwonense]